MPTTAPATDARVSPANPTGRHGTLGFRPDIDGLRAVAILLVVGYHASVPGFGAGFVGVDVFFVISGFLIMGQLEGELLRTGTIGLRTFWARRARRLIPAATLVLLFVAIATPLVLPVHQWKAVAAEVLASTFYGANELFRTRATDYFAAQVTTSPLLNMWSLAVEEQFYLFWPVVLFATSRVQRRAGADVRGRARRRRLVTISAVVALSFLISLNLTQDGSQAAYFSAVSRAWEFGVGALLAMAATTLRTWRPARTRVAGAAGLGLLVLAAVLIDKQTPFPGVAALLPVLGTAGLIVAGLGADTLPARTLGCRPLQAVGRLSYSWYLWHWPVLILGLRWRVDPSVAWRVQLVALSLVPAIAAHHLVEKPLRTWPVLTASNRRTLVGIVALLAVSTASAGALWARGDAVLQDPFVARVEAARVDLPPLPDVCATTDLPVLQEHCVWGDRQATRTVLVIGDSHAGHWLPAVDQVGQHQHLRVIASMQGSCPSVGFGWTRQLPSCTDRIAKIPGLVRAVDPDLVVMSNSIGYLGELVDGDRRRVPDGEQLRAWEDGVRGRAEQLRADGVPLLLILDVPRHVEDPIECLMRERAAPPCAVPLATILQTLGPVHEAERAGLAAAGHGSSFDPLPWLCPDTTCPAVGGGGEIVYGDLTHITPAYARSLEGPVAAAMTQAMAGAP